MIRVIIGLAFFCCAFQAFSTSHPKPLERCEVNIFDPSNKLVDKFSHTCEQLYGKQLPRGTIQLESKTNGVSILRAQLHEPIGYCSAELKDKLFSCVTTNEYLITIEVKLGY
ncbi:hypothetical protein [Pseudoalteromonas sp.]|uniref:hypothetical protein n=1 Tax=Pseudoalteromonas sp. TaxID=53249 RepID=UPI002614B90F|nr:hypothetical protein [Pseudoalteromonas sp.]MCP4588696.1 hypothetical protein [Pseudoalteromonas sp.]